MRLRLDTVIKPHPEGAGVALLRYKYGALVPAWCVAHAAPMVGAVVRRPINSPTTRLSSHDLELQLHSRTDSANTLIGSTGADSFVALDGNDNILAAQSNDIVDLGDGQDTVSFNEAADGASVSGGGGNDSLGLPLLSILPPLPADKAMTPLVLQR